MSLPVRTKALISYYSVNGCHDNNLKIIFEIIKQNNLLKFIETKIVKIDPIVLKKSRSDILYTKTIMSSV